MGKPAARGTAASALFINGVYEEVLNEIINAQISRGGGHSFLQPYKGVVVRMLNKQAPTSETPIRLYLSTTKNLSQICYIAEIVGWEDKRHLSELRRHEVSEFLHLYQPGEAGYFDEFKEEEQKYINLITIRRLRLLESLHSTSLLRKVSDGLPLKKRTRAGGWSEVYDVGDLIDLPVETQEQLELDLSHGLTASTKLSDEDLQERLAASSKKPERVQVVSIGFRRNPHVIEAVLRRAKGICEKCGKPAPFLRRSDGSPYLEVHHWDSLSEGGDDTVENAAALCPNCHCEVHHG